jgi:hypothetical protein
VEIEFSLMVDMIFVYRRYYPVDSGYAVQAVYLELYRNQRYHLQEFIHKRAETVQEKFNYHHSSLHNVVEQAFGVLKSRWHILRGVPYYARKKQIKIVIACFALHTFLLEVRLARTAHGNVVRDADYEVSVWVAANASEDMADVQNFIAAGIGLI